MVEFPALSFDGETHVNSRLGVPATSPEYAGSYKPVRRLEAVKVIQNPVWKVRPYHSLTIIH